MRQMNSNRWLWLGPLFLLVLPLSGCANWYNLDYDPMPLRASGSKTAALPYRVSLKVSKTSLVTPSKWDGSDQYQPMSGAATQEIRQGITKDIRASGLFSGITRHNPDLALEVQVSFRVHQAGVSYFFMILQTVSAFTLSLIGVPWSTLNVKSDAMFILKVPGVKEPVWERSFRVDETVHTSLYYAWGFRSRPWNSTFRKVMYKFKKAMVAEKDSIIKEITALRSK